MARWLKGLDTCHPRETWMKLLSPGFSLESEPGHETSFCFSFPFCKQIKALSPFLTPLP